MQLRPAVVLLSSIFSLLLCAGGPRAEAVAHAASHSACLAASVDALRSESDGQPLYRIVFLNRCEAPRSFFWCAEHPSASVPSAVACPGAQGGLGAELRYVVRYRKEFQWHLPRGVQIRFLDCPAQETPTAGFRCEAPVAATRR